MKWPLSLSGDELDGDSLVRFVYVDESGTSGQSFLVVAGVIIHADSQWKPVEQYIAELIEKYVAEEDRKGFTFHATELFSGTGKVFGNRQKYSLAHRCEALKELLSIPSKFHLPIVFGFIRRLPDPPGQSTQARRESIAEDQALAFSLCAVGAENFMRKYADPSEIAKIVAEDNTETKEAVRRMHETLRGNNPAFDQFLTDVSTRMTRSPGFLPIRKIVDAVSFEGKKEAMLLQISDACALIIRYYLEERSDIADFIKAFSPAGPERITNIEAVRSAHGGRNEVKCWV